MLNENLDNISFLIETMASLINLRFYLKSGHVKYNLITEIFYVNTYRITLLNVKCMEFGKSQISALLVEIISVLV